MKPSWPPSYVWGKSWWLCQSQTLLSMFFLVSSDWSRCKLFYTLAVNSISPPVILSSLLHWQDHGPSFPWLFQKTCLYKAFVCTHTHTHKKKNKWEWTGFLHSRECYANTGSLPASVHWFLPLHPRFETEQQSCQTDTRHQGKPFCYHILPWEPSW
jgi:hypothetical protein